MIKVKLFLNLSPDRKKLTTHGFSDNYSCAYTITTTNQCLKLVYHATRGHSTFVQFSIINKTNKEIVQTPAMGAISTFLDSRQDEMWGMQNLWKMNNAFKCLANKLERMRAPRRLKHTWA
jgi:hypothetical protein